MAGLNHIPVTVELMDGVIHVFVHVGLMFGLLSSLRNSCRLEGDGRLILIS